MPTACNYLTVGILAPGDKIPDVIPRFVVQIWV